MELKEPGTIPPGLTTSIAGRARSSSASRLGTHRRDRGAGRTTGARPVRRRSFGANHLAKGMCDMAGTTGCPWFGQTEEARATRLTGGSYPPDGPIRTVSGVDWDRFVVGFYRRPVASANEKVKMWEQGEMGKIKGAVAPCPARTSPR